MKGNFLKYDGVYTWKNHLRCAQIASKLSMFEECQDGVDRDSFIEYVNIAYCELIDKKYDTNHFKNISFKERLNIVCKHHLE